MLAAQQSAVNLGHHHHVQHACDCCFFQQTTWLTAAVLQDGVPHEQDEESAREVGLLQIELETTKAIDQIQMLQQVSDMLLLPHEWVFWSAVMSLHIVTSSCAAMLFILVCHACK